MRNPQDLEKWESLRLKEWESLIENRTRQQQNMGTVKNQRWGSLQHLEKWESLIVREWESARLKHGKQKVGTSKETGVSQENCW